MPCEALALLAVSTRLVAHAAHMSMTRLARGYTSRHVVECHSSRGMAEGVCTCKVS